MYTDPIADLLTRIRNGYMSRKDTVTIPYSGTKMDVLNVMKQRNFIEDFKKVTNNKFQEIEVKLNPSLGRVHLKRVSKPGQRIYLKALGMKKVNGGMGVAIVSTPKGIMSGEKAKEQNLGGELICEIY